MKHTLIISLWLALSPAVTTEAMAQRAEKPKIETELGLKAQTFVEGYASDNGVGHFTYHSVVGPTDPSLLVRSTSAPIEWQSAVIPKTSKGSYAEFLWVASADAGGATPEFYLHINGQKRFTIVQGEPKSWTLQGADGATLSYFHVTTDGAGDSHGYMLLKIPTKWAELGKPVDFKIEGSGKGGNAWLMVYRNSGICHFLYSKSQKEIWANIELADNGITIATSPLLAQKNIEITIGKQTLRANIDGKGAAHVALPSTATPSGPWRLTLPNGQHFQGEHFGQSERFYALSNDGTVKHIDATKEKDGWKASMRSTYQPEMVQQVKALSSSRISKGTIYLMNSSHQDIAWMDTPEKCIIERDTMLITPMIQKGLKSDRFSFDIEDGLMVKEYLTRHPQKKDELLALIDQNKLGVGATYAQPYEEMYSGEALARQFYLGKRWLSKTLNGYNADSYWNMDVPGRTLQMPQLMAKAGVPNLIISRQKNGVYRWKAPDGSSVLTFSLANYNQDYSGLNRDFFGAAMHIAKSSLFWEKGYNDVDASKAIIPILSDKDMSEVKDYSSIITQWQLIKFMENDGQLEPINLPSIRLTTTGEFMKAIACNSTALETIQGERPDLWLYIHGPSHHKAISASRDGDRMIVNAEKFSVFDALSKGTFAQYPQKELEEAWEAKIYPDHGWGGKNGDITDAVFESKYMEALHQSEALTNRAIQSIASRIKTQKKGIPVVLFNGLSWQRTAPVTINLSFDDNAMSGFVVKDAKGKELPAQLLEVSYYPSGSVSKASVEVLAEVPAMGYTTCYITPANKQAATIPAQAKRTIETDHYRMELGNGGVKSLVDKASGQELLNAKSFLGAEIFTLQSVGNGAGEFVQVQQPTMEGFDKVSSHQPQWQLVADGPLFTELTMRQPIKHAVAQLSMKVYKHHPRIDFNAGILSWEGVLYREFRMSFPLADTFKQVAYEVPFGVLRVGQDELKGAAGGDAGGKSYDTPCDEIHPRGIASWIGAYNDKLSVVISSSVAVADYKDLHNKDQVNLQPILLASRQSCHWEGNPYLQTGDHRFSFSLTTSGDGLEAANRAGIANNEPILVAVNPDKAALTNLSETMSFMSVSGTTAIVSAVKKAEEGNEVVVRLYSPTGNASEVKLGCFKPIASAVKTNLLEEPTSPIPVLQQSAAIKVDGYGIETIKLKLR